MFDLPQVTAFSTTRTAAAEANHTYIKRNKLNKANTKMAKKVILNFIYYILLC